MRNKRLIAVLGLGGFCTSAEETLGLSGVRGSNLFQISPHFELKQFEFALPISFVGFKKPANGAFLRLRGLGIGIDNMAPLPYRSDVSMAGVYVKWTIS